MPTIFERVFGGEQIEKQLSESEAMEELGATGLNARSGFVIEEFLPALQGDKAAKVYRQMGDNDPIAGAMMLVVDMLIKQVEWPVEPASDAANDREAAEFLESVMHDLSQPWKAVVSEALTMVQYGWSWIEEVYKTRGGPDQEDPTRRSKHADGRVGWRKLAPRAQDTLWRWEFDEDGGVRAMIQQPPPDYVLRRIPIEKSLLFRTSVRKNNPEGRSMLRNAYRPWLFKTRIEEIEAIGVERDLAGYPTIGVPRRYLTDQATPQEKQTVRILKKLVTSIRRDRLEGMVRPIEYDDNGNEMFPFSLLSTAGRRQIDTSGIINRYDQRIAMTMLADFILLGHEKVGSFALSDSKTNIFLLALRAILDEIEGVVNRFAVTRLFSLNSFNVTELPRITYSDVEDIDVGIVAKVLSDLANAGGEVFPNEALVNTILRRLGLPEMVPDGR